MSRSPRLRLGNKNKNRERPQMVAPLANSSLNVIALSNWTQNSSLLQLLGLLVREVDTVSQLRSILIGALHADYAQLVTDNDT